tara:strand:- start:440 stop:589 length:150 start_codon:yes stop_codon:yes gene_type:complete
MNRAEKYFHLLPKGTHFEKVINTEFGDEKIYISPDGEKHYIPTNRDLIS